MCFAKHFLSLNYVHLIRLRRLNAKTPNGWRQTHSTQKVQNAIGIPVRTAVSPLVTPGVGFCGRTGKIDTPSLDLSPWPSPATRPTSSTTRSATAQPTRASSRTPTATFLGLLQHMGWSCTKVTLASHLALKLGEERIQYTRRDVGAWTQKTYRESGVQTGRVTMIVNMSARRSL